MKEYLSTPKGTRDVLLDECETQSWIEDRLKACFRSYGYNQVITPGIEYLDVYADAPGNAGIEHMFKLIDNEGRILVLRPDSTGPIARLTASRLKESLKPVRLYYNQRVYRQKNLYSGHRVETSQMGVELIGANSIRADMEALELAVVALMSCDIQDYRIELGHGGLCALLISRLDISGGAREQLKSLIQSKNYPALNDYLDALGHSDTISTIKALPGLFGGPEVFEKARKICDDEETQEIISYTRTLFDNLRKLGLGENIMIDLGFANDNDYYTGVIFQAYIPDGGEAALLGGRYDRLLGRFGDPQPAVGFGVNIDLLTKSRMSSGRQEAAKPPQALVWGGEGYVASALSYARDLRLSGDIIVENGLFESRQDCERYARSKGIKEIHIIGATVEVIAI